MKNNLSSKIEMPLMVSILFSVHPVHVEAVCGNVGRADLLAANTFLLSFLIYNKAIKSDKVSNVYLFTSIILAGTSMLFKENGITVLVSTSIKIQDYLLCKKIVIPIYNFQGVCCVYDFILHLKTKSKERLKRNYTFYIFNNFYLDIKCIYRLICVILSTILLLYGRWIIMGATKPEFKPTDNPTAFSDDLFVKVCNLQILLHLLN